MIGWFFVSGGLFWGSYVSTNHTTRNMCRMMSAAWMILTVGLLLLGNFPGHD